jgi:hypothetical protein
MKPVLSAEAIRMVEELAAAAPTLTPQQIDALRPISEPDATVARIPATIGTKFPLERLDRAA